MELTFGPTLRGQSREDCLILKDGTDRLSRNVGNYQSTLRHIPEERRSHLHRAEAWNYAQIKSSTLFTNIELLLPSPHSAKCPGSHLAVRIPKCVLWQKQKCFSLHSVKAGYGVRLTAYLMFVWDSFTGYNNDATKYLSNCPSDKGHWCWVTDVKCWNSKFIT